jgi:hypothetical protein
MKHGFVYWKRYTRIISRGTVLSISLDTHAVAGSKYFIPALKIKQVEKQVY